MDKAALRRGLRARREASAAAPAVHELIHHQVRGLPEWVRILDGTRAVLVYLPLPGEVDTWPLIQELWGQGVRTLAPCCCPERSGEMDFLEFRSTDELVPGRYDILEPDRQICRLCAPHDAYAVLVPALAFDRDGYRLGFGGGYYDRLLSRLDPHILTIGLTFHDTLQDRLPREAHDQPVRVVCTERETIRPPAMTIIPFSFPGLPNIKAAFTTRLGGVSQEPWAEANLSWEVGDEDARVLANHRILQRRLGFDHWFETRQVHGVEMIIDPGPPKTGLGTETGTDGIPLRPTLEADGSATSRPGLALIVKTADCQPILLAHRDGRHVAALHCGWRGNRQGFPQKGVAAFCQAYGLRPADILAVRGPSLGPGASEFVNFDLEWGDAFRDYFNPATQTVDLWRLTRDQLLTAGLRPDHIFGLDLCTANLPETFFSYRRDKITGRQVGLIWIA